MNTVVLHYLYALCLENDAEDEDISALFSSSESLLDGSLLKSVSLASGRLKCCGLTNKVCVFAKTCAA